MMDGARYVERRAAARDSSHKFRFTHEATAIFASLVSLHEINCEMCWSTVEAVAWITRGATRGFNPLSAIWSAGSDPEVTLRHYSQQTEEFSHADSGCTDRKELVKRSAWRRLPKPTETCLKNNRLACLACFLFCFFSFKCSSCPSANMEGKGFVAHIAANHQEAIRTDFKEKSKQSILNVK